MKRLCVLCVLLCMLFSSCSVKGQKTKYTAYCTDYFDTVITVVGYEETKGEFDAVANDIFRELGSYHALYTVYDAYDGMENLYTVNETQNGAHRTVTVDERIIDLLLYAKEMYAQTNGKVNIAMGSVLSIWHSYRTQGKEDPKEAVLPPMTELQAAAEHTDISHLVIDKEAMTVTLTDPDMKLDVGAIAKGYATERVARLLEQRGLDGYILNVGGNIRAIGTKPGGEKWSVGIEDPVGEEYLAHLSLAGGYSVTTSGSYQRYYEVDGVRYHHIIDPDTLLSAEGFLSVSVICTDAGYGDALSTALFCMPQAEGLRWIETLPDVEAMWLSENWERTVSSGWNDHLKK